MTPYNLSVLFFGYCSFLLSLLIYLKRQDGIGRHYFIFGTFVTLWALPYSVMISTNVSDQTALISSRICNLAAAFIGTSWLHFVMVYARRPIRKKSFLTLCYVGTIGISVLAFSGLFVPKLRPIAGFDHYTTPGVVFHFFTVMFFVQALLGFYYLNLDHKQNRGVENKQTFGFMMTTGIGFIGGALTFFPVYGVALLQYNLFVMPFYPFLMAYFMMRKGLFDEAVMAEAARRDKLAAIGTLASSLNHEIKNPLYVIQGTGQSFLSGIQEGIYPDSVAVADQAAVVMERMTHQATRAIEIMRKFSNFAKRGIQQSIDASPVCLREVYENILPLVQHELETEKIELMAELPETLPLVKADPRDLEEIFFNLIVNAAQAIKAQSAGSALQDAGGKLQDPSSKHATCNLRPATDRQFIRVTARSEGDAVHVTIQDSGPGIPKEDLKKIFEPFYTTKSEGTGLGLYITRQLVERNQGKISLGSIEGQGTTLCLELNKI